MMQIRTLKCLIFLTMSLAFTGGLACDADGEGEEEELPAVECASAEVPVFEEMTVWNSCIGCHSSTLSGAARQGAPVDFNYDSLEEAMFDPLETAESVIDGSMPPAGALSAEDMELINVWAQCGS